MVRVTTIDDRLTSLELAFALKTFRLYKKALFNGKVVFVDLENNCNCRWEIRNLALLVTSVARAANVKTYSLSRQPNNNLILQVIEN